ncbi:alpha-amylase family glycosyl hydrolase [Rhodanobacter sp. C01]|uniref:alpha-amylase family glycosyl hydrolase n=1 Tax=Rhodanobacter sp. C01 TaxID=1945856 RepID=UPI000985A516|nr:alpha-amylase family glycosyl hydrolase [Rhodanobacter sp. C01]OOG46033.1 alpha-amylase [Rhodanobacter sp. C01]
MPRFPLLACTIATAIALLSPMPACSQPDAAQSSSASAASQQAPSDVWYEIFVRSFYDTNGDGIGDLNGVTAKLDYLKSLGVSGIWLMPINPSPSYHGYDITDYDGINPQYGTMADFRRLLDEAHKRGIKVIIDMVINHSSNEHPWFKAALDPHSPYHDWYSWADKYTDLDTLSATGVTAWHADGAQNYLGIFAPTMPDLNYDNRAVRAAMIKVGQFWLKQGVDGFRLDAAQHIYDNLQSDMDDPAALAKNLAWWNEYRHGLDAVNPHAYLVGEVTRPVATELAPYFKPLDAVFNFPLAVQLITAAKDERNLDLATTLEHTYASYRAADGGQLRDAPFLSNHDQERVMSQLGDNPQHMRMAAAMLLTLPGQPYIYYGEELGMRGRKPDEALREPMRWQRSPRAQGTATWEPPTSGDGLAVSVEAEQADPHSLLHYYTTLIHWRSEIGALRDGGFRAYPEANDQLVAWQRTGTQDTVLVVHNLSGQNQSMPLDVPGEPHFGKLLRQTGNGAAVHGDMLELPPYSSVILQ